MGTYRDLEAGIDPDPLAADDAMTVNWTEPRPILPAECIELRMRIQAIQRVLTEANGECERIRSACNRGEAVTDLPSRLTWVAGWSQEAATLAAILAKALGVAI